MTTILKSMEMLRKEGWFCEMNLPCCSSCAWSSLPLDIDSDKVLFNHEQDMENIATLDNFLA